VLIGSHATPLALSFFIAPSSWSHIRKSRCLSFSSDALGDPVRRVIYQRLARGLGGRPGPAG
jgi:hypothetical protein